MEHLRKRDTPGDGAPAPAETGPSEAERLGAPALHARLTGLDPLAAASIHPNDQLRIIRALEVHAQTGQPLGSLRAAHALVESETLVVGDGANDLGMIEAAGLGVAYRAKPVVADAARARIDHADLTALLYFQGYREKEIVT